jgi:hypothetical protein
MNNPVTARECGWNNQMHSFAKSAINKMAANESLQDHISNQIKSRWK